MHHTRKTASLYNVREASVFKLSRLRVPRYRHFMQTMSFAIVAHPSSDSTNRLASRFIHGSSDPEITAPDFTWDCDVFLGFGIYVGRGIIRDLQTKTDDRLLDFSMQGARCSSWISGICLTYALKSPQLICLDGHFDVIRLVSRITFIWIHNRRSHSVYCGHCVWSPSRQRNFPVPQAFRCPW